ncbi:MAG: glycine--tRNA ligase subunit beta, partial [Desulfovibrionaceae bacterium]
YSTPRRAIVVVSGVNPVQQAREEVLTGPPLRAAYDNDGCPTKALEGFARTHNVPVDALFKVETDKGEYIAVHKHTGGAQVTDLLQKICPAIINALPFAKRMRWGNNTFAYARPLRWIVALLDDHAIPFSVGPVSAGRQTFGHRIHGAGPFTVPTAAALLEILSTQGAIVPDTAARRAKIIHEGNALADAVHGTILWKESLLDEVQGLCEQPSPLLGDFDPSFLEVPRQVLLTSMESHQKSFGVQDTQGNLLPHFLTVLNLLPQDRNLVKRGWERVLRARLEDARFFWRTDLSESLDSWLHKLDSVIFLGPLGSMGDKTRRLADLCAWLSTQCHEGDTQNASRAGRLSKADLVTGMVGEFDTLQGIMGGIYAERMGENAQVAQALAEQYLPAGPDSPVATSPLGALLSMADKADTMVGCFGLGMIPTGTADSNGLRRCALGIARTILDHGFRLDMDAFFRKAQELYGPRTWKIAPDESLTKLHEFFGARLKNLFIAQGADTLLVEAAMGAGFNDVWAAKRRLQALENLQSSSDFVQSVQTFKRVTNIVRKQGQEASEPLTGVWKPALLEEDAEKALAEKLETILPRFDTLWAADDFDGVLALIQDVRPHVDTYFEGVMVMCDDAALRVNRLNILKAIIDRLGRLADFAALQI